MQKSFYVGVSIVEAWPQTNENGEAGYVVKAGSEETRTLSWLPAEMFERVFLDLGNDPTKVTLEMVDGFITKADKADLPDGKTTFLTVETKTGFSQYETSSCVDPKNYDSGIGAEICMDKVRETLWKSLGFVLQWARYGLNQHKK